MKYIILALWCTMLTGFAQQPPALLPFQGRLLDATGAVIDDGTRVVQFKVYDAPVGGQTVWNGEVHKLTVNGGMVNTLLGTKSDLSRIDFNRVLYLEMTIDANADNQITLADPPLLPRQAILPAVFAKESATARESARLAGHDWSSLFGVNDPVNGQLPGARLANASVAGSKIAQATITAGNLAEGSIAETHLSPALKL